MGIFWLVLWFVWGFLFVFVSPLLVCFLGFFVSFLFVFGFFCFFEGFFVAVQLLKILLHEVDRNSSDLTACVGYCLRIKFSQDA